MEYIILGYYLTYGLSTAFLMSKIAPAKPLFWIMIIILWPICLPIAALGVYSADRLVKKDRG